MDWVKDLADGFTCHGSALDAPMLCEDLRNKPGDCPSEILALRARRAWRSRGCSGRRRRTLPSGAIWRSARAASRTPCARSARPSRSARSRTLASTLRSENTEDTGSLVLSMHRHRSSCRPATRLAQPLQRCAPLEHKDGDMNAYCWSIASRDLLDRITHFALMKYTYNAAFWLALESSLRFDFHSGLYSMPHHARCCPGGPGGG